MKHKRGDGVNFDGDRSALAPLSKSTSAAFYGSPPPYLFGTNKKNSNNHHENINKNYLEIDRNFLFIIDAHGDDMRGVQDAKK